MFLVIIIIVLVLFLAAMICLLAHVRKLLQSSRLKEKKPWMLWGFSAAFLAVLAAVLMQFFGMVSMIIIFLHLFVFWLVGDLVVLLVKKIRKKELNRLYTAAAVFMAVIVYFSIGWYNAHHVSEVDYQLKTAKDLHGEKLRILQITDMHVGATFDADGFAKLLEEAGKCKPDIIVATGDFVDEGTTKKEMIRSVQALGEMESSYGTYFVYGNHDKGIYSNSREFTAEEFEQELVKNGIIVLEDETVLIDNNVYIVGRKDATEERLSMDELTKGLDKTNYMVVLDHQPIDYEAQKEAGADLVLSGHTHGGHIFPAGLIGEQLTHINCMTYGLRQEDGTAFEVSSGISGWEIPFKTGCISEYVVIDVEE